MVVSDIAEAGFSEGELGGESGASEGAYLPILQGCENGIHRCEQTPCGGLAW
jgi:hypothetical protein